jgi:Flp pilus assembly protein CpaB
MISWIRSALAILVAGGLIAPAFWSSAARGDKEEKKQAVVAPDQVKVLVAKKRLSRQTLLSAPEEVFEVRMVPRKKAPKDPWPAEQLAGLKGRLLNWDQPKDSVLSTSSIFADDVENLEDIIPRGHRAVAIKVSPDAAAGGLLLPGSHVDVFHTVNGVSTLLLENKIVLAVNDTWQRSQNGKPLGGKIKTVTLEAINIEQALKLMAASERGTLRVALRHPHDEKPVDLGPAVPPPPPPPAPKFDPK